MKRVLLSSVDEDLDKARALAASLRELGMSTWSDLEDIPPGEDFLQALRKGFDQSDAFVVLVSEHSVNCPQVQFEFGAALVSDMPIIPIVIGDAGQEIDHPDWLGRRDWIDARGRSPREVAKEVEHLLASGATA